MDKFSIEGPEGDAEVSSTVANRRTSRRTNLAQPALIRPADPKLQEEVRATVNLSTDGLYFTTTAEHYSVGMQVEVVYPYRSGEPFPFARTVVGEVVRLDRHSNKYWGVAVRILTE
jgi:hypothetical protein